MPVVKKAKHVTRAAMPGSVQCPMCKGRGCFELPDGGAIGQCFTCKGKGSLPGTPARNPRGFSAANPTEWAWISRTATDQSAPSHELAVSLLKGIKKYGSLTDAQLDLCRRLAGRSAQSSPISRDSHARLPANGCGALERAFAHAKASGLKHPRLTIGALVLSPAGDNSRNPGAIYVKSGGTYVGKIVGNVFSLASGANDCRADVEAVMADPLQAATLHGKRTGRCACCGLELTDPVSIERGIGPVCAQRFGA